MKNNSFRRSKKSSEFIQNLFFRGFPRQSQNNKQASGFSPRLKPESFCDSGEISLSVEGKESMSWCKKGQLKENTIEVLVAVILIVVVFAGAGYLIYKYFQLSNVQNDDEARGLLNVLEAKMNALKEGEQSNFLVRGPCEGNKPTEECLWYLTGWGKQDDGRPQKCFFKSCVCVCRSGIDATTLRDKDTRLRDACQGKEERNGFCTFVDVNMVAISSVQQRAPFVVVGHAAPPTDAFDKIEKSFIPFKSNLIELKMKRTRDGLEISLV